MFKCAICADGLLMVEEVSSTICGHIFHKKCLLPWFEHSKNCPQCRKNFGTTPVQNLYHRVYLPDIINRKDEIMDRLNDVVAQCDLLKKQKKEKEKELNQKNKDIRRLLKKRMELKKKQAKTKSSEPTIAPVIVAVNDDDAPMDLMSVRELNRILLGMPQPTPAKGRNQFLRRLKRTKEYFKKKREAKKASKNAARISKEMEANAAQAV